MIKQRSFADFRFVLIFVRRVHADGETIEPVGAGSSGTLAKVPPENVRPAVRQWRAIRPSRESSGADEQGVTGRDNERDAAARVLGSGARKSHFSPGRIRCPKPRGDTERGF